MQIYLPIIHRTITPIQAVAGTVSSDERGDRKSVKSATSVHDLITSIEFQDSSLGNIPTSGDQTTYYVRSTYRNANRARKLKSKYHRWTPYHSASVASLR